jgi:hypothetical protein
MPSAINDMGSNFKSTRQIWRGVFKMKRLLPAVIAAGLVSQALFAQGDNPRATPTDWEEINFEFNQAVIVDGFPGLLRLAELLKTHPDYKVQLVGNADQVGSNAANDRLALQRANAVAQFLQKYGVNANQVMVRGDGKRNLEVNANNVNARFINRRVVITVTAPDGSVIGDGSLTRAIEDFMTYARGQLGKIDGILAQLQALEAQVRQLNTADIKTDTAAIRQDTQAIRQDTGQIRQDTGTLVQRPTPLTADQTTQIAQTAARQAADYALTQAALRNRKYGLVGFDWGPTFGGGRTGNYSTDLYGKLLIPFGNGKTEDQPGTHGIQVGGNWDYFHKRKHLRDGLDDGFFDIGLVNRFNHIQIGSFAQFDYITLNQYQGGGFIGAGIVTIDYIFSGGNIGIFGGKGFKEYGNISTTSLSGVTPTPAYVRYDDQLGVDASGALGKHLIIESSVAFKKRYAPHLTKLPSSMFKLDFPVSDTFAIFAQYDNNPTLQNFVSGNRVVFGIEFGNWLRQNQYGTTTGVIPLNVPRPHYELLAR